MNRLAPLLVVAVGLAAAAVVVVTQSSSSGLPPALRTHLQDERFQIVTSIRGLPLGVREKLQELFGSGTLDIAEPGAEFAGTGARAVTSLPSRRLVAAGCATDGHCLVHYERSGEAPTRPVTLFHWTPAETRFEWGGSTRASLATIDDVRKAIVTGAIKGEQAGPW